MAIPDYESLMLPLLRIAGDGKRHTLSAVTARLSAEFKLSESEQKELLPSGTQFTFYNRVGWARTYLKKAGLLVIPARGHLEITERGLTVLKNPPGRIDNEYLMQFGEFREFKSRPTDTPKRGISTKEDELTTVLTPRELIESGANSLRKELAEDILTQLRSASSQFFEQAVVDVLLKMGYGGSRKEAGEVVGRSGDGGIDGIIKQDRLGLDLLYVQAKRWEATVGRPIVQAFVGALEGRRAQRGIIITTSRFSEDAIEYANTIAKKVVLIDGDLLANLMIDHEVGVTLEQSFDIKKLDTDYFSEE